MESRHKLRFSERRKLQSEGTLGPLTTDHVPPEVLAATRQALATCLSEPGYLAAFHQLLDTAHSVEVARTFPSRSKGREHATRYGTSVDEFLDYVELVLDVDADFQLRWKRNPRLATTIDAIFSRHRFGYRIEAGFVHPVLSPALEAPVVHRALLLARHDSRWSEVERRFSDALSFLRHDEFAKAIHEAASALECGLKADGYNGHTLGELAKDLKSSKSVPGSIAELTLDISKLVAKISALRNVESDAHGHASPTRADGPMSALTIHMVGSLLVYLHDARPT